MNDFGAHTLFRRSVKSGKVDRESLDQERSQDLKNCGKRITIGAECGEGPVRTVAQDATDVPRARTAGPDFQEDADSVLVRAFDDRLKVGAVRRRRRDCIGRRTPIDGIGRPQTPL